MIKMTALLRFLTILLFSFSSAHTACVFYRGFHFLAGKDVSEIDRGANGIHSRVTPPDMPEEEALACVAKIKTLSRPWTTSERSEFKPTAPSPMAELVQLYTNSYNTFTTQLRSATSRTRRIFRLAGLELTANPFLSTTLKVEHALRYGSGLKLFGHDELRRYPEYDAQGKPKNGEIGFVDTIIIPQEDLREMGAFFVLEAFATGDTKLSYHWSKKLIEEQEVIFPFIILRKYHSTRVPLKPPHLGKRFPGIHHKQWLKNINAARATSKNSERESDLTKRLCKLSAASFEKAASIVLQRFRLSRRYTSTDFYPQRNLIPDDATQMRKKIVRHVDVLGREYAARGYTGWDISGYLMSTDAPITTAYAFRSLGQTAPLSLRADIALGEGMNFEALAVIVQAPQLRSLSMLGPEPEGICPEFDDEEMDQADMQIVYARLANTRTWSCPHKNFSIILKALETRATSGGAPLTLDITGQSLDPTSFYRLSALVDLQDDNRETDEEAMAAAENALGYNDDGWDDYYDDDGYGSE